MREQYCEDYKAFLNQAKTETEAVRTVWELAKAQGFQDVAKLDEAAKQAAGVPGTRLIQNIRGKGLALAIVGKKPISQGSKVIAAHVDSPRLDLKPEPLSQKEGLIYLKTHYYGGIKKYQWTCIPMALHGKIVDRNGNARTVVIGEKAGDPLFGVSDLLPHLAGAQMAKSAEEAITGEQLQLLAGIAGSDGWDQTVRQRLKELCGIDPEDFKTAEFEAVPTFPAADYGLDRSMIGAYGQDDRSCGYGAVRALLDLEEIPEYTSFVLLADQEEVGSESSAGLYSSAFLEMAAILAESSGVSLYRVLAKMECLSADVICAYDPMFPETADPQNTARLGGGLAVVRYTGRGGKKGNHSAAAAFLAKMRDIFEENHVIWQCGEMGAADAGGGTTVAKCLAGWGAEVLDVGIPLLSMHAPLEISAREDVWNYYLGMRAFLEDKRPHECDRVMY